MNKRFINIRVAFCFLIGLIAGILVGSIFLFVNKDFSMAYIFSIIFLCLMLVFIVYAISTYKFNKDKSKRKSLSHLTIVSSICAIVAFIIGLFSSGVSMSNVVMLNDYEGVVISGKVVDYINKDNSTTKFMLSDCYLFDGDVVEELDGKILVYVYNCPDVNLGDKMSFESDLKRYNYLNDYDFSKLIQGVSYSTVVSPNKLIIDDGNPLLADSIRYKTKVLLEDNLNTDNSKIAYSILFGDKNALDDDIKNMFSYAGISHILAVSGLHVAVLVGLIYGMLKKLKINRYIRLVSLAVVLIFYSYVCSFSVSVVRASIMAIQLAFCDAIRIEYDPLSSLSVAGIIVLCTNPLNLFSLSFQLSFLCVFSIIALAPTLTKLLKKIKCPDKLSQALAISIATNIVILPVCMNYFAKVSLLGILANLIIIPIFSYVYILLFLCVIAGLIIRPIGVLLFIPDFLLHIIKVVAEWVASIPFGIYKLFRAGYIILFLIMLTCLIVHFVMIKWRYRSVIALGMLIIICVLFNNAITPSKYVEMQVNVCYTYEENMIIYANNNKITLLGSRITENNLIQVVKKLKINKIDNIVAYDLNLNTLNEFKNICKEYNVDNIYIPSEFNYEVYGFINKFPVDAKVEIDGLEIEFIRYGDQIISIYFGNDLLGEFLYVHDKPTKAEGNYISKEYINPDYLILSDLHKNLMFDIINADNIILNGKSDVYNNIIDIREEDIMCFKGKINEI